MKDEIKEILEELKEKNETYKECSENGIIENKYYKSHLLLDYITNLQEEYNNSQITLAEEWEKRLEIEEKNKHLDNQITMLNKIMLLLK